jgi:hypothetical protein
MGGNDSKITAEMVVTAFEHLALSPTWVQKNARNYQTVDGWVSSQAWQTGVAGAAALAVPVAHVPLIAVDLIFLFHKMAYCCLGIGVLKGCEIEPNEDFAMILSLYTGALSEDALEAAVGTGLLVLTGGAVATVGLPKFISQATGMGVTQLAKKVGAKTLMLGGKKMSVKAVGLALEASSPLISAISGKVAEKLAAKFATKAFVKSATSAIGGFLPVLGSVFGGGINMWFVRKIAKSAETYYDIKARSSPG